MDTKHEDLKVRECQKTPKYRCNECGQIFFETQVYEGRYQEYPGASYQSYFVSPCCHTDYEEID